MSNVGEQKKLNKKKGSERAFLADFPWYLAKWNNITRLKISKDFPEIAGVRPNPPFQLPKIGAQVDWETNIGSMGRNVYLPTNLT